VIWQEDGPLQQFRELPTTGQDVLVGVGALNVRDHASKAIAKPKYWPISSEHSSILPGKDPATAPYVTSRTCGVQ
jgi:hypothetical protein